MPPLLRRAEHASILNLSGMLGSLGLAADPDGPFAGFPGLLAYNSPDTGIAVNSAGPGYVATDLSRHSGTGTAASYT